jgi:hypothetical protein
MLPDVGEDLGECIDRLLRGDKALSLLFSVRVFQYRLAILEKSDKVETRARNIFPYAIGLPVSNCLGAALHRDVHAVRRVLKMEASLECHQAHSHHTAGYR